MSVQDRATRVLNLHSFFLLSLSLNLSNSLCLSLPLSVSLSVFLSLSHTHTHTHTLPLSSLSISPSLPPLSLSSLGCCSRRHREEAGVRSRAARDRSCTRCTPAGRGERAWEARCCRGGGRGPATCAAAVCQRSWRWWWRRRSCCCGWNVPRVWGAFTIPGYLVPRGCVARCITHTPHYTSVYLYLSIDFHPSSLPPSPPSRRPISTEGASALRAGRERGV